MDKFKSYYPDRFNFLPKSYKLPEEESKLQRVMNLERRFSRQKIYIAKPTTGS